MVKSPFFPWVSTWPFFDFDVITAVEPRSHPRQGPALGQAAHRAAPLAEIQSGCSEAAQRGADWVDWMAESC